MNEIRYVRSEEQNAGRACVLNSKPCEKCVCLFNRLNMLQSDLWWCCSCTSLLSPIPNTHHPALVYSLKSSSSAISLISCFISCHVLCNPFITNVACKHGGMSFVLSAHVLNLDILITSLVFCYYLFLMESLTAYHSALCSVES